MRLALPPVTSLPPSSSGDIGAADPALVEALATYADDGSVEPVVAALARARLLLPVMATPGEIETADATGLPAESTAEIAVVFMQRADGRKALLAFSGLDTLTAWNPQARPVPVSARAAAQAVLADGADAMLIDVAGPARCVVETDAVGHLAAGHILAAVSPGGYVWLAEG